jgi:hypothetical protein
MKGSIVVLIVIGLAPFVPLAPETVLTAIIAAATRWGQVGVDARCCFTAPGPNLAARLCIDDISLNTVDRDLAHYWGPAAMEKRIVTLIAFYLAPPFVLKTEVEVTTVIVAAAIQGKIRIEAHCSSVAFGHDVSGRPCSEDVSADSVSRDITNGRSPDAI